MNILGWIFMTLSMLSVLSLVVYCVSKVLFYAPKD